MRTTMSAGEEHLLDVGLCQQGIDLIFVLVRGPGPLPCFNLVVEDILVGGVVGSLGGCRLVLEFSPGAEEWDELDTMLVESQGMAEMNDGVVRAREWQVFWNQTDRLHGVPTQSMRGGQIIDGTNDVPHAKELNLHVNRKGSFELHAQFKTLVIIPRVHGIRERQLFVVAWREKADFLEHASKGTCREGTARETENTDLIPDFI